MENILIQARDLRDQMGKTDMENVRTGFMVRLAIMTAEIR
jgi:hypothetical protein